MPEIKGQKERNTLYHSYPFPKRNKFIFRSYYKNSLDNNLPIIELFVDN